MSNYFPTTNFKDSNGVDLGKKLITKDYLMSVYPELYTNSGGPSSRLFLWGSNSNGQLANNQNDGGVAGANSRSTPQQEIGLSNNWKRIRVASHGLAIKYDGTLWSWGDNSYGNIGDNTRASRSTPRQIGTATNWRDISVSIGESAAIKTNGTLWCWGDNSYGQLGDNTRATRSTPRQIGTGTNWKQVDIAGLHCLAVKTDGTLWGWGNNNLGQVGDNTRASRSTPRQIGTATDWKQVSSGGSHSLAIKVDGTLWGWGFNSGGQIGDNTTASRSTPRQVGTATNWRQVSAGYNVSAAIKTDGTLWTWGRNQFGVLGNNESDGGVAGANSRSTPQQEFTSSTNWKQVAVGNQLCVAIKSDGTLWAWGRNHFGQLGNNTLIARSTPVQEFTSSTNWRQVDATGSTLTGAILAVDI
jgi:alpha-tubulin suppressor-like RCC1 family protein